MRYFVNTEVNYNDPEWTGTSFICCVYDGESYEEIKSKIIENHKVVLDNNAEANDIVRKVGDISLSDSFSEIASKIKNIFHGYQETEFYYFKISEPYTDPSRIADFYFNFFKKANGEFQNYENTDFYLPDDMKGYYKKFVYMAELINSYDIDHEIFHTLNKSVPLYNIKKYKKNI